MIIKSKHIEYIEMSIDEHDALWDTPSKERKVFGAKVVSWNREDGNNTIYLEDFDMRGKPLKYGTPYDVVITYPEVT